MCAARLMFLRVYFSLHEFLFETIFSVLLFGMNYFYLLDIVATSYFIGNVNMVGCVHFRPCLFLMFFFFLLCCFSPIINHQFLYVAFAVRKVLCVFFIFSTIRFLLTQCSFQLKNKFIKPIMDLFTVYNNFFDLSQ